MYAYLNYSTSPAFEQYKYLSLGDLANEITLLAAQINAATYCFLKMLAEFDNREGWRQCCMSSCCHWLNWKCAMTYTTAREKLRVAHCLERLPLVNKEFEAGKLSYSKVRAITRVATDENEHVLVKVAMENTASHLDKLVRRYQKVDAQQNPIEQIDEHENRKLEYYQDSEGMWVIKGRLQQVEGGLLIKALEEIVRQQNKNASAEAQEKLVKSTSGQNRADALSAMAEHFIATAKVDDENGGLQPLAGHERCQVVLHLSAQTLKAEHQHNHNCHHNATHHLDGQWISAKNAKRFSSDASLYTVLEDKYGNVLNLGRKVRTVTTALKRALNIRDKTCRFPGCCANKYVDFHHIQHWSEGGHTEPDNLIKLCRFHHDLLHKDYYTISSQQHCEHNKWIFKTADGEVIKPNPAFRKPISQDDLTIRWPKINHRTGTSLYSSKPLNYNKVIRQLVITNR